MKLSNETIEVLKSFAGINSNIAFGVESKTLRSVAISKNIMGKATITEDFPYKFGIYDLNQFLSCVGLFNDPNLVFSDNQNFVTISDSGSSIQYFFSDIENLVTSDKDLQMPESEVTFTITNDQLNAIRKASGIISGDHVIANNNNGVIKLTVTDTTDPTSNKFSLDITNCNIKTTEQFDFIFNVNSFKFKEAGEYVFDISSKMISAVKAGDTNYWIALDKNSKYGV
jgi:hypothetical protein